MCSLIRPQNARRETKIEIGTPKMSYDLSRETATFLVTAAEINSGNGSDKLVDTEARIDEPDIDGAFLRI